MIVNLASRVKELERPIVALKAGLVYNPSNQGGDLHFTPLSGAGKKGTQRAFSGIRG